MKKKNIHSTEFSYLKANQYTPGICLGITVLHLSWEYIPKPAFLIQIPNEIKIFMLKGHALYAFSQLISLLFFILEGHHLLKIFSHQYKLVEHLTIQWCLSSFGPPCFWLLSSNQHAAAKDQEINCEDLEDRLLISLTLETLSVRPQTHFQMLKGVLPLLMVSQNVSYCTETHRKSWL